VTTTQLPPEYGDRVLALADAAEVAALAAMVANPPAAWPAVLGTTAATYAAKGAALAILAWQWLDEAAHRRPAGAVGLSAVDTGQVAALTEQLVRDSLALPVDPHAPEPVVAPDSPAAPFLAQLDQRDADLERELARIEAELADRLHDATVVTHLRTADDHELDRVREEVMAQTREVHDQVVKYKREEATARRIVRDQTFEGHQRTLALGARYRAKRRELRGLAWTRVHPGPSDPCPGCQHFIDLGPTDVDMRRFWRHPQDACFPSPIVTT
jgi:hypothetical protein